MVNRKEYPLKLLINGKHLSRVLIDQHYKLKHPEMTDELILKLVKILNNGDFEIEIRKGPYEYFAVEPVYLIRKSYRLVLLLCVGEDFLGVINAFRR